MTPNLAPQIQIQIQVKLSYKYRHCVCILQLWWFEKLNFKVHISLFLFSLKISCPSLLLPLLIFSYLQVFIHSFLWWWVCFWLIYFLEMASPITFNDIIYLMILSKKYPSTNWNFIFNDSFLFLKSSSNLGKSSFIFEMWLI